MGRECLRLPSPLNLPVDDLAAGLGQGDPVIRDLHVTLLLEALKDLHDGFMHTRIRTATDHDLRGSLLNHFGRADRCRPTGVDEVDDDDEERELAIVVDDLLRDEPAQHFSID